MTDKHKNDKIILELLKKFELDPSEDVFEKYDQRGKLLFRIIPRRGIDKIEARSEAVFSWSFAAFDKDYVYIDAWARIYDKDKNIIKEFHTTGEADRYNVGQKPAYLAAVALARGKARAYLGIEGLYQYGFFSEEEADEFKDIVKEESNKKDGNLIKKKSSYIEQLDSLDSY